MNAQVRKLFALVLVMFLVLGVAATIVQFFSAPTLQADGRNSRRILQSTERDRGAIIVDGEPVAYSKRLDDGTKRFERVYPEGETYAPVTGYFSVMISSATGIEKTTDTVLEGDTSELFTQRVRDLFAGRARQGGGVELTINSDLQQSAAKLLNGRKGAVVVEEAKTGRILALYSSPSFDPNPLSVLDAGEVSAADKILQEDPDRPLDNRAIASNRYAPGSVFKILTAAVMLENGVKSDTVLDSPISMTLPGTESSLFNIEGSQCGSGKVTLSEAFARSCNTTFALAVGDLGAEKLADMSKRFGFGAELSIPLAVTPSVFPEEMNGAQLAMSSIGQFEVAVTPLQMAMVTQAVANDGVMMKPYLVDKILDADNREVSTTSPSELSKPISAETARTLKDMMKGVVDESYGTGTTMALPGVEVAAKTGTAEVGNGDMTNAWALALAPADDPQLVVSVVVEGDGSDPTPHGGTVAGPIVRALLEVGLK